MSDENSIRIQLDPTIKSKLREKANAANIKSLKNFIEKVLIEYSKTKTP